METEDGDVASTSDVPGVRYDLRPEDFTGHVVIGRGKYVLRPPPCVLLQLLHHGRLSLRYLYVYSTATLCCTSGSPAFV